MVMELEDWFCNLMDSIKQCKADNVGSQNYNFSIVLEKEEIERLVDLYDKTKWIEIY